VPWGINRRRLVTINDGEPGEKSISIACMHCTDAPCIAVCPVSCIYQTEIGIVLHDKDLCIGSLKPGRKGGRCHQLDFPEP
jgi:formate dehydrogenase iron-sulfur subunit